MVTCGSERVKKWQCHKLQCFTRNEQIRSYLTPPLTTCLFARRHYGKFPVLLNMSSSVALLDIGNDFCAKNKLCLDAELFSELIQLILPSVLPTGTYLRL